MNQVIDCHRRRFLRTVAGLALSRTLHRPLCETLLSASQQPAKFAYVGVEDGIQAYSIAGDERFVRKQTIASGYPVAMVIRNWNLYVVNGISEFAGLPRGTAESYGIDAGSGMLKFKNRMPLSLSAVRPRSLAVSPDGRDIVVAVHGGGAFNVLPIEGDGSLGRVTGILKETGSGPHSLQASAHPSALLFDSAGRVLSVDQGSDKLNVFALRNHEMAPICRHNVIPGSGPTSIVLDPKGNRFYVAQTLNPSVSSFRYDATAGKIVEHEQTVSVSIGDGFTSLAMHPSGGALYSSHGRGIQGWKISGNVLMRSSFEIEGVHSSALYVANNGKNLFALTSDAVLRMRIDASTQMPAGTTEVASLPKPLSIAMV